MPEGIFDPLDYRTVATSLVSALLSRPIGPLPPGSTFAGGGVYAIYYRGPFRQYAPISATKNPIYVGKAVPKGGRKGGAKSVSSEDLESLALTEPAIGPSLYNRLCDQADSLRAAQNLELGDFTCRYLAVTPVWISFSDGVLIRKFRPVWNVVVNGFGNHHVGKTRFDQRRADWDEIHPGRDWAMQCKPAKHTAAETMTAIAQHFSGG